MITIEKAVGEDSYHALYKTKTSSLLKSIRVSGKHGCLEVQNPVDFVIEGVTFYEGKIQQHFVGGKGVNHHYNHLSHSHLDSLILKFGEEFKQVYDEDKHFKHYVTSVFKCLKKQLDSPE